MSLHSMAFKACLADPDVNIRKATKTDRSFYYEYLPVYMWMTS